MINLKHDHKNNIQKSTLADKIYSPNMHALKFTISAEATICMTHTIQIIELNHKIPLTQRTKI